MSRLIISRHYPSPRDLTPDWIASELHALVRLTDSNDAVKLVVTARNVDDCVVLRSGLRLAVSKGDSMMV
jgi:hypothetical protein